MITLRPHFARAALVGLAAAASMVVAVNTVTAAELTGVITNITVSPTTVNPGDRVRTDIEFCVPDSATAGDTFSLALAEQLSQLPASITLRDPSGAVVAVATISGAPAVATFELTSYVDDRVDVCGTAFFESELSGSVTPNSTQTLTFVLSGGATFDTVITVGEPDVGTNRSTARKSAVFNDSTDQCRTALDSCLSWFVESRPGPFASVVIADDGLVDATFECATLTVRLWTLKPDGSRDAAVLPGDVGATITSSCTTDSIDVTASNVPAGVIVRSLVRATPSFPDPDGNTTFRNVASVTHVGADQSSTTDETNGRVRSSAAGGEASGVTTTTTTTRPTTTTTTRPTTTTTTRPTTTTTTRPTTTTTTRPSSSTTTSTTGPRTTDSTTTTTGPNTSDSTTTTESRQSGAATTTSPTTTAAPRLPDTGGSSRSLTLVALATAMAGAAMIVLSRRRPVG
jgi:LPXTG-motif cell wall-anchored protein